MFSLFGCGMKKLDGDGMVYKPAYVSISQDEAKLMMREDDGHIIVDVRRADEYAQGHIPGAILIPNESITDTPPEASGKCVYCNHCEPCPAGIDIGAVNKFYDLARIGDDMAREHYRALEKNASDCFSCGHCNSRCPFSVDQMGRMQEIKEYYGQHLA